MPAAEAVGVKMVLHRDDPPVLPLGNIGRIFISAVAIRKALSLYGSLSHGITFCQGTYTTMGENVEALIQEFGSSRKIFFVEKITKLLEEIPVHSFPIPDKEILSRFEQLYTGR